MNIENLIKASKIPMNTPEGELITFIEKCNHYKLNPYLNEVKLVDRYNYNDERVFFTIIGINGYRKIAHDNGLTGISEPLYDGLKLHEVTEIRPNSCSISITKNHNEFSYAVTWKEYAPKRLMGIWVDKPFVALSTICEAFCLRKAFMELNGSYIEEEIDAMPKYLKKEQVSKGMDFLTKRLL